MSPLRRCTPPGTRETSLRRPVSWLADRTPGPAFSRPVPGHGTPQWRMGPASPPTVAGAAADSPPRRPSRAPVASSRIEADVVWVAHAGLDHLFTVADLWRELPLDGTVRMRWWRVPADEVPAEFDAQVEWLYTWWERIDAWVDATRTTAGRPGRTPPGT